MATVTHGDRVRGKKDPMNIKGYIWVRPPKGHCFIIQDKNTNIDRNVCKPTQLSYKVSDIDPAGKINWNVIQADDDEGTKLSWQTPYRIANFIPLGEFNKMSNIRSPLFSCKAENDGITRKITLTFFDEKKWYIPLPDKDELVLGKRKRRKLFVRVMSNGLITDSEMKRPEDVKREAKRKNKMLAQKLKGLKKKEGPEYSFLMRPYEAYEMNSSRVMESGGPLGQNGVCRYKFTGAWNDEDSGVVECFNTDSYDALYVHLPCASQLPIIPFKTK